MSYLYSALGSDHTIDGRFGERIESSIGSSHEIRFQQITAVAVVLEFALIQLERQIGRLEVQRHHLAAGVPKNLEIADEMDDGTCWMRIISAVHLRHVIGRISSGSFRVDATHLALVVVDELDGVRL